MITTKFLKINEQYEAYGDEKQYIFDGTDLSEILNYFDEDYKEVIIS